jgi:hypothetical protein
MDPPTANSQVNENAGIDGANQAIQEAVVE